MRDPNVLLTLRRKREEIEDAIRAYEAKIAICRRDLAHVSATIQIFEVNGEPVQFPVHMNITRLFKRFEMSKLCREALECEGPLTTRELAVRVLRAKGLDGGDAVLRKTIAMKIVQSLSRLALRGAIGDAGKRRGVRLWKVDANH